MMPAPQERHTLVLCILDGFGLSTDPRRNALMAARMPNWRRMLASRPHCRLDASGTAVGLPAGQMGNSEVGHLNLGAGFPVLQDLPRISAAIADGSFFDNAVLRGAVERAVTGHARLHVLGLVGPGGVHAIDDHLVAIAELARRGGLPPERILLHAFTDGRDTAPRSAGELLPGLLGRLAGVANLATVSGRFYAMDRDQRWERIALASEAIVHASGEAAASGADAVSQAYARGEGDEFIRPTVIGEYEGMGDGDVAVHANFRADRARELTGALALDAFGAFDRGRRPANLTVVTLTEYQRPAELPVAVAFPPLAIESLAAHLSRLGLRQLHVAETEKYAHVTYFFNGGVEAPFPGEERSLLPSRRDVATYDLAPEMSAAPITERVVAAIRERAYDFIVCNYANPDMVAHTGVWEAAVRAAEVIDGCLGELEAAALAAGATLLITADHGNIEQMRDEAGNPQTKHTTSPVPFMLVDEAQRNVRLRDGILADVAPTICALMGIPTPPSMTGRNLLVE